MIRRLEFASCYAYSPRGVTEPSQQSRQLCYRIKAGDAEAIRLAAERVREFHDAGRFPDFFGPEVTLVAVPGRAPLAPGATSRTQSICDALAALGLGREVLALIARSSPVTKSAYAAPADRPSAEEHHATIDVQPTLVPPARILLVDDVVTRGSTLLGAASRVRDAYDDCEIRGFALIRTISLGEVEVVRDPCAGWIERSPGGGTVRRP